MRYSVFDYVNVHAKIVVMGITPGELQANEALRVASLSLKLGHSNDEVVRRAKVAASFAGPMRSNLIALMDYVGIAQGLGITSCESFWSVNAQLVHFTSALRYPVFLNGSNYSGSNPKIPSNRFLREAVVRYTGQELNRLKGALLVPLGPAAESAAEIICEATAFPKSSVVFGLPHPSGANGERIAYFLGKKRREELSRKTNPEKLDQCRLASKAVIQSFFG